MRTRGVEQQNKNNKDSYSKVSNDSYTWNDGNASKDSNASKYNVSNVSGEEVKFLDESTKSKGNALNSKHF